MHLQYSKKSGCGEYHRYSAIIPANRTSVFAGKKCAVEMYLNKYTPISILYNSFSYLMNRGYL